MAGKEILLTSVPRLSRRAAMSRENLRGKTARYGPHQRIFSFPHIPPHETLFSTQERHVHNMATVARLARRETISDRPNEKVASIAKEHIHSKPAQIADHGVLLQTEFGDGWLPFQTSTNINVHMEKGKLVMDPDQLKDIKEIYIVQHGVMRNAKDYYQFFKEAFLKTGKKFDPKTMLIVAPQFLAPVDLEGVNKVFGEDSKKVLRWRYADWRGGESAQNPDTPIDSFTAMDAFVKYFMRFAPGIKKIEFRGNSEGAQFLDRYLTYSKFLKDVEEYQDIDIHGIISNAGTAHYPTPIRPKFNNRGEVVGWNEYALDSEEHLWPLGLYDPPPYVLESLDDDRDQFPDENPLDRALRNYLNRTILSIGTADNDPNGSQLPSGPGRGYKVQGRTRLMRYLGKVAYLDRIIAEKRKNGINMPASRTLEASGFTHSAREIFEAIEVAKGIFIADDKKKPEQRN